MNSSTRSAIAFKSSTWISSRAFSRTTNSPWAPKLTNWEQINRIMGVIWNKSKENRDIGELVYVGIQMIWKCPDDLYSVQIILKVLGWSDWKVSWLSEKCLNYPKSVHMIWRVSKRSRSIQMIFKVSRWPKQYPDDLKSVQKIKNCPDHLKSVQKIWKTSWWYEKCLADQKNVHKIRNCPYHPKFFERWSLKFPCDLQSIHMIWTVFRWYTQCLMI